jgi:uncharacterized membrane protein
MDDVGMWLRFLHIFAALWLAAGAIGSAVVRAQTGRAKTLAERVFGIRLAYRMINVLNLPGSILVGVLGFGLISTRGYSWSAGWIQASIAIWALMLGLGLFYTRPFVKKVLAAAEASLAAGGAPNADLQRLVARNGPARAANFMLVGFVVLVLLMVFKPF